MILSPFVSFVVVLLVVVFCCLSCGGCLFYFSFVFFCSPLFFLMIVILAFSCWLVSASAFWLLTVAYSRLSLGMQFCSTLIPFALLSFLCQANSQFEANLGNTAASPKHYFTRRWRQVYPSSLGFYWYCSAVNSTIVVTRTYTYKPQDPENSKPQKGNSEDFKWLVGSRQSDSKRHLKVTEKRLQRSNTSLLALTFRLSGSVWGNSVKAESGFWSKSSLENREFLLVDCFFVDFILVFSRKTAQENPQKNPPKNPPRKPNTKIHN